MAEGKESRNSAVTPAAPGGEDKNESDLAKSYFLARMSHEMRTPLNAIIGMVTIAQTSGDLEKTAECLSKIHEASKHLLAMINDILDIAKIESGNFRLTMAEFNPAEMFKKAAAAKKFTLDAKKQNLTLDYDPALPEIILSDERSLFQVLDHLLSNAIKFTLPEGTITLYAKKLKEEGQTCTLEIGVRDTGIGIPAAELEKIFSIFEQVDGGISRKYGGAGLGLAICAHIVHLLGGRIRVESEPRKGSSFSFEITVEKGTKKAEGFSSRDNAGKGPAAMNQKYAGKFIILAEDVEINREIALSLLEDSGAVIDCAENGREALDLYTAAPEKYSAILMDIQMPGMDGYEAARRIRAFESDRDTAVPAECRRGQIPIIAMTANIFKDDVEKCLAAGMSGHVGKPIEYEELIKQLDRFLL